MLDIAILQIMSKDHPLINNAELISKLQMALNIPVQQQSFDGRQLRDYVQKQAEIVANMLLSLRQRGVM